MKEKGLCVSLILVLLCITVSLILMKHIQSMHIKVCRKHFITRCKDLIDLTIEAKFNTYKALCTDQFLLVPFIKLDSFLERLRSSSTYIRDDIVIVNNGEIYKVFTFWIYCEWCGRKKSFEK